MDIFQAEGSRQALLFSKVIEYVKSQNWKYRIIGDGQNIVELHMNLKSKLNSCHVLVVAEEKCIQAFAVCPLQAQKDTFANVSEYITRANYGLKMGNFELDYRDGEIRYRSFLSCREGIPSLKDIEYCVDVTFLMMNRYGDGLAKNIMGFGDPARDVEAAENP